MNPPKFWVEALEDEHVELFVGETSVGVFNHDEHGFSAMNDALRMFERTAKAVGAEFERRSA